MDIFVGNLPYELGEDALRVTFSEHGAVSRVKMLTDRDTGRSRGIAFVTMDNANEAQAAIDALDGHEVAGRAMKVNQARERSAEGPSQGGGRQGGGSRQNRY